ncbi:BACON domain-containing protein [Alistipes finegoldii]|jgi:fibrobacter succinogenes major domain (fib_succ_major)|uniref:BACON domain-containing protein n=1 Tax=Alistipes finegoldii TaxID=214856 RepID=UPI0026737BA4|nr:BACON domain-containing carbohydrate-binding protein [Alistipes finegoldii]MEE0829303.1 BACON domain-containing carbohydrate-binding protein [Alistipes finegoldii]
MKTLRMLYTAALLSAAMLLAGCYSTDTDDDLLSTATLISIYPSTVSVGSAAATQNVVVTLAPKSKRNLDWSCSVQSAWVTAVREKVPGESTGTVYEDAVVLVFLENTAYKRQTTLTITASDGTVLEVPVVQKGIYADAYVKAAPESLTFMAENPQPAAVAIDTNMDTFAAVSDSDWCTVVDNGDGTITVTCTEYGDNTADRTAEITVTAGTPDTSEARTVIPVTQLRKDVYCYLYGSGVPKYPTREKWGQMTKLSDRVYVDSVYVKNGRFSVYTTEGDTYHLDGAGNLSAAETDLTVDVAGLRIVTLNLNEKTYSIERITTPNCLPDSEVAKYATSTYTANGRTKVWMRAGLDWNGGENIGGIKLGSRMVSDANNVGGYTSNVSSYETVRVSDYDEVESGGKAQGEVEMSAKYGRIYTLTEFLTGTPKAAVELARLLTDWPAEYRPGSTFVDAVGNDIPVSSVKSLASADFENTPSLSMQIQGICPYGWHVANVQDFYDMLCAAAAAKGVTPNPLSAMIGKWSVPDVLRSAEGWSAAPTRHAAADAFGFDFFPQGRRLFKSGYQYYASRGEMFICHPGGLSSGVYQCWRINALTNNAADLTVSTTYNIGDCSASFRCVKNYENF